MDFYERIKFDSQSLSPPNLSVSKLFFLYSNTLCACVIHPRNSGLFASSWWPHLTFRAAVPQCYGVFIVKMTKWRGNFPLTTQKSLFFHFLHSYFVLLPTLIAQPWNHLKVLIAHLGHPHTDPSTLSDMLVFLCTQSFHILTVLIAFPKTRVLLFSALVIVIPN